MAGISSARSINEDTYYMQRLFRGTLNSRNIDHCARSCHAPTVAGLLTTFGTGGMTNSLREIENAKMFFCIGTNMTQAHPVVGYFVKSAVKKGAKMIVCDPRRHQLADYADVFAQIKVGSDVAFINSIMNVIIKEDLYDKEFVKNNTEFFEEMKKTVSEYPPERGAEISGVSTETIIQIARMMVLLSHLCSFIHWD